MHKNEAFSRVLIDAMLAAQGWDATDPNTVRFEVVMPDSTPADYVLCDRNGRSLAVIEAKRHSVNPADAAEREALCAAFGCALRVSHQRGRGAVLGVATGCLAKAQAVFDAMLAQTFSSKTLLDA